MLIIQTGTTKKPTFSLNAAYIDPAPPPSELKALNDGLLNSVPHQETTTPFMTNHFNELFRHPSHTAGTGHSLIFSSLEK